MDEHQKSARSLTIDTLDQLDWEKGGGLLPAIIQNAGDNQVLMLGYMNRDAAAATLQQGRVTFYSRSKQRLWMKGETSGNVLNFVSGGFDCDGDTILIQAEPAGPACHTGDRTCFGDEVAGGTGFLAHLEKIVQERRSDRPENSYTTSLFDAGKARIAQKVGEEGVELALARMKDDQAEMANEAADLIFHMLVLLADADMGLDDVIEVLRSRHG